MMMTIFCVIRQCLLLVTLFFSRLDWQVDERLAVDFADADGHPFDFLCLDHQDDRLAYFSVTVEHGRWVEAAIHTAVVI